MCHLAASPFFPCFAMMAPLHAIQTPRFISILISKKDLHHYHLSYSLLIVYCIFVRTAAAAWFKMWYISTCNSAECSTNDAVIWLADRICGTNPETCYARVCTTNLTYRNIQFIHHIESCLLSQNALQYTHFSQLCTSIPPQYIIHSCKFAKLNLPLISREHTRKKKRKKRKKAESKVVQVVLTETEQERLGASHPVDHARGEWHLVKGKGNLIGLVPLFFLFPSVTLWLLFKDIRMDLPPVSPARRTLERATNSDCQSRQETKGLLGLPRAAWSFRCLITDQHMQLNYKDWNRPKCWNMQNLLRTWKWGCVSRILANFWFKAY
jgi:hypothetical protein